MPGPWLGHMTDEEITREIAREEIASLCGLVLNRLGELEATNLPFEVAATLKSIFGEALRDFGATTSEPGPEPS